MTEVTCSPTQETITEIQKLLDSKEKMLSLILSCNKKSKEITVADVISEFPESPATVIGDALPDSSPRFIICKHGVALDSHYDQTCISLIWYNPLNTDTTIKRSYMQSKDGLVKFLPKNLKQFELSSLEDFTDDWFSHKIVGITGKTTKLN